MAPAVLALFGVLMLLTVIRTLIQRQRTGDWGNRRTLLPRGSLEWWGLAAVDLGLLLVGLGAPLADWAGMPLLAVADHPVARGLGVVFAVLGTIGAFGAQLALGASWRIGVDEAERTALVTTGPFRLVRNPVFAAVAVAFLGMALMVPNPIAIAGLAVTLVGMEMQVRLVEEPYLRRIHGAAYTDYATGIGRFLPGIGRQRQHRT